MATAKGQRITDFNSAKSILILAHGDLDGIISAIMITKIAEDWGVDYIDVVFTMPKWIARHKHTDIYDLIIVVDVAVNNRDTRSAQEFIEKNGDKLIWIDHHYCPDNISGVITDPKYKSCVRFIKDLIPFRYSADIEKLIEEAHLADQGKGDSIFHKALKANQKSNETRREIYIIGTKNPNGEEYDDALRSLRRRAEYYDNVLLPNTMDIVKNKTIIWGCVAVVDIRHERKRIMDMTLLAFELYKSAPIVVIKYFGSNKKQNEFLKVSTKPGVKINLVRLFGLESGAPFKITVPNTFKDDFALINFLAGAFKTWEKGGN